MYARVSTADSHQDVEVRLSERREYAQQRKWRITEEYADRGVSGAKISRPALDRLMKDAKRRAFDIVLAAKLDRFGRSLRHLLNSLAELEAVGVVFVSLRDNIDLGTPAGRLMVQIIGAMAEFERSLIQERIKAGLRYARAKGKRLGRPRLGLDDEMAAHRALGLSYRAIARELGISLPTVWKRLRKIA